MYAREYSGKPPERQPDMKTPRVETFENRAALDEMARRANSEYEQMISHKTSQTAKETRGVQQETKYAHQEPQALPTSSFIEMHEEEHHSEHASNQSGLKRIFGSINTEDLLLLFLILLLLTDGNSENDFIIPLLLVILFLN